VNASIRSDRLVHSLLAAAHELRGRLHGDDGRARKRVDEQAGGRVGANATEPVAPGGVDAGHALFVCLGSVLLGVVAVAQSRRAWLFALAGR